MVRYGSGQETEDRQQPLESEKCHIRGVEIDALRRTRLSCDVPSNSKQTFVIDGISRQVPVVAFDVEIL